MTITEDELVQLSAIRAELASCPPPQDDAELARQLAPLDQFIAGRDLGWHVEAVQQGYLPVEAIPDPSTRRQIGVVLRQQQDAKNLEDDLARLPADLAIVYVMSGHDDVDKAMASLAVSTPVDEPEVTLQTFTAEYDNVPVEGITAGQTYEALARTGNTTTTFEDVVPDYVLDRDVLYVVGVTNDQVEQALAATRQT